MTTTQTASQHRITWFVYVGGEKIRRQASMRGQWDYDVKCSCGQRSRTGGAVRRYVEELVWAHKTLGSDL